MKYIQRQNRYRWLDPGGG